MIRDVHPGSGSWFFYPSQIPDPGVNKAQDPDPLHCFGWSALVCNPILEHTIPKVSLLYVLPYVPFCQRLLMVIIVLSPPIEIYLIACFFMCKSCNFISFVFLNIVWNCSFLCSLWFRIMIRCRKRCCSTQHMHSTLELQTVSDHSKHYVRGAFKIHFHLSPGFL